MAGLDVVQGVHGRSLMWKGIEGTLLVDEGKLEVQSLMWKSRRGKHVMEERKQEEAYGSGGTQTCSKQYTNNKRN